MKSKTMKILSSTLVLALVGLVMMSFTSAPSQEKKPWDVPAKYKAMKNPHSADKSLINVGKMQWNKHCKSCHGGTGLGDGPKAKQLKTPMMDFSAKDFQAFSDGEMYYMSFIGRDEMPNFEKKIPDEEDRWAIVNFMRTMAK
jgi:mono/diheme cytochrome c family protein